MLIRCLYTCALIDVSIVTQKIRHQHRLLTVYFCVLIVPQDIVVLMFMYHLFVQLIYGRKSGFSKSKSGTNLNRPARSCFVFNFFSTFTKHLRPSFNYSERRSMTTINKIQFIMNNSCLNVKCSMHFNVEAKVFCIHLKQENSLKV
jgi:hypothetical protein